MSVAKYYSSTVHLQFIYSSAYLHEPALSGSYLPNLLLTFVWAFLLFLFWFYIFSLICSLRLARPLAFTFLGSKAPISSLYFYLFHN
jgi:hypothetical protein